jgi:predicted transcriptional regulator
MAAPHPGDFLDVMRRRGELLRAIGPEGAAKRALESRLDVSRSTIDRGIRELEAKDLVERTDDGYRQTLTGRIALADYEAFTSRIEGLCEGSELLTKLPADADLSPAMLAGADVVESTRTAPGRPARTLYDVIERADSVRGFSPSVHPQQVETFDRRVEAGMDLELVLTDAVIERILAVYADPEEVRRDLSQNRVTVFRTDAEFPYSLTLSDVDGRTVAGVMVYVEGGPQGCLVNDSEAAVEWAERRYERARDRAERLQFDAVTS